MSEAMQTVEGWCDEEPNALVEENPLQAEVMKLRRRWELASVLNFLDVFGPLIGKDSKLSAEQIEMGLIKPDASLAQLHITLLKGMPPVSKMLDDSDAWVSSLCKKLTMWWPWVAEGKIPFVPSKGEEISKYKELDPSDRLIVLKALCEIRADQHDAVSYINVALKEGTQVSSFRKEALGGDGKGTSYWYDASPKGHRLYKEVITLNSQANGCSSLPTINFQWETLASSVGEFSKVAEEFSSSEIAAEVTIGKKIQSDAIPIIEKLRKNKESALKRKQRQDMLLNYFHNSYGSRTSRSSRNPRPVDTSHAVSYPRGVRWSKRLAGVSSHTVLESRGLTTNHITRQRPIRNSALESIVVPDSDDEGKIDSLQST